MSFLICTLLLVGVVGMIIGNAYFRYKEETKYDHIETMHPTLIMAHTMANRNQKSYALVRNGFGDGVSIVPWDRVGLHQSAQKVVAVVEPIPLGDEYNTVPYEFMKPSWSPAICAPTVKSAGLPALLDLQPSS